MKNSGLIFYGLKEDHDLCIEIDGDSVKMSHTVKLLGVTIDSNLDLMSTSKLSALRVPWEILHIDLCGPVPSNEYLLVLIDRHSRYPELEIVRSTKAGCMIPKLEIRHFLFMVSHTR